MLKELEGCISQKREEGSLSRLMGFAEGLKDHPLEGILWLHLNYLPISGISLTVVSFINGNHDQIRYLRARVVLNVFGQRGLRALKEHFWPGLDFGKMREMAGPRRKRHKEDDVLWTFQERTPLYNPSYLLPEGAKAGVETQKSLLKDDEQVAVLRRRDGWREVDSVFLSRGEGRHPGTGKGKSEITTALNREIREFIVRRINPHLSLEEVDHFLKILKLTFSSEGSPEQLGRLIDTFSRVIQNLTEFLTAEKRDSLYQGNIDEREISERVREMAWGLLNLCHRADLPKVSRQAGEQIGEIKEKFRLGRATPNVQGGVLKIFSLDGLFPPISQAWLKKELSGGYYEDIYRVKNDLGDEAIVLEFTDGIDCPITWKMFQWLALRFPFSNEVFIEQNKGETIIVNILRVRERMLSNIKTIPNIPEFYSYKGRSSLKEKKHLLTA